MRKREGNVARKIVPIVLVLAMVLGLSLTLPAPAAAEDSESTWYVDDDRIQYPAADFQSIQAAVGGASDGDTIIVYPGRYEENVVVDKSVTIESKQGAGETTVESGVTDGRIFEVKVNDVTISGFTITSTVSDIGVYLDDVEHCTVSKNTLHGHDWAIWIDRGSNNMLTENEVYSNQGGIYLVSAKNNVLESNELHDNSSQGISLTLSVENTIVTNEVHNNQDGVFLRNDSVSNALVGNTVCSNSRDGIWLSDSRNNSVTGNTIYENWVHGVCLQSSSAGNFVEGNTIYENGDKGISLHGSNGNTLKGNRLYDNTHAAVSLVDSGENTVEGNQLNGNMAGITLYSSDLNTLYGNTMDGNTDLSISIRESSTNTITRNIVSGGTQSIGVYDSSNNEIYLNDFVDSSVSSYVYTPTGSNTWCSPFELWYSYRGNRYLSYLGNYWSDYDGGDSDGNGIGDISWEIGSERDDYPLMESFKNYVFRVYSTNPLDGAEDIRTTTSVTVEFTAPVVLPEGAPSIQLKEGDAVIAAAVEVSGVTVTIIPLSRLAYDTTYTVYIPAGAAGDEHGNLLGEDYIFSFTTRVRPPVSTPEVPTPPGAIEPVSDSEVESAIEKAEDIGEVVIEAPEGVDRLAITKPQLEKIAESGKPFRVQLNRAHIVFPTDVVADLSNLDMVQVEIGAELVPTDAIPPIPPSLQLAGDAIDVTVTAVDEEGNRDAVSEFASPVVISIPVPSVSRGAAAGGKLDVYRFIEDSRMWKAMVSAYDNTSNRMTFATDHLSKYASMEKKPPSTKTYPDIQGHWAKEDVEIMAGFQIVRGMSEAVFAPDMSVTRAQFAALLIRSLGIEEIKPDTSHFRDVSSGSWHYGVIEAAYAAGLINGYEDGTFRPDEPIKREEIAALVARTLRGAEHEVAVEDADLILSYFEDADQIGYWAKKEAAQAVASGIIRGRDGLFAPREETTRAEAVVMLRRMLSKLQFIE